MSAAVCVTCGKPTENHSAEPGWTTLYGDGLLRLVVFSGKRSPEGGYLGRSAVGQGRIDFCSLKCVGDGAAFRAAPTDDEVTVS